jgi:D-alanyl-D-alanine carboxypeptidase
VVSLTGHLQTAGGRLVVFSLIANGPGATSDGGDLATAAIDDLVTALAADPT